MKLHNKFFLRNYSRKNYKIQIVIIILFIIGIIFGSILSIKLDDYKSLKLMDFLFWSPINFRDNELEYSRIFIKSMVHNIYLIFTICLSGLFNWGIIMIPIILSTFGSTIGFLVGFFIKTFGFKGFLFSTLVFFPKLVFKLPIIFIITTISMTNTAISPRRKKIRNDLDQILVVLIVSFLIIIAVSLFEGIIIKFILNNFII